MILHLSIARSSPRTHYCSRCPLNDSTYLYTLRARSKVSREETTTIQRRVRSPLWTAPCHWISSLYLNTALLEDSDRFLAGLSSSIANESSDTFVEIFKKIFTCLSHDDARVFPPLSVIHDRMYQRANTFTFAEISRYPQLLVFQRRIVRNWRRATTRLVERPREGREDSCTAARRVTETHEWTLRERKGDGDTRRSWDKEQTEYA